jgi:hypothetical protein
VWSYITAQSFVISLSAADTHLSLQLCHPLAGLITFLVTIRFHLHDVLQRLIALYHLNIQ